MSVLKLETLGRQQGGAHFLRALGALGHFPPGRFGTEAAIPDILEHGGFRLLAGFIGTAQKSFAVGHKSVLHKVLKLSPGACPITKTTPGVLPEEGITESRRPAD